MAILVLSIKPKFAEAIFSGKKTFEYRKTRPRPDVTGIYIHVCGEDSNFVQGYADYSGCTRGEPRVLFKATVNHGGGIDEQEFNNYFSKAKMGYALRLVNARRLERPVSLSSLGLKRPPQSFAYVEI